MILWLIGLWLAMLAAGETSAGRVMRRWLVAKPAATLGRVTRAHLLLGGLVIGGALLVAWLLGHDGLAMLGMAAPELTAWMAMIDAATLVDVLAMGLVTASAVRWRAVTGMVRARTVRRAPRSRRVRRARPPANDDDGPQDAALAA